MTYNKEHYLKYKQTYSDYNKLVYQNMIDKMSEEELNAYRKNSLYKSKLYYRNNRERILADMQRKYYHTLEHRKIYNEQFNELRRHHVRIKQDVEYLTKNYNDVVIMKTREYVRNRRGV